MSRIVPLTGAEADRRKTVLHRIAREIHTTEDQRRFFFEDTFIGPIHLGTVEDSTARNGLFSSHPRGCWPGDTCVQNDTGNLYLCINNNGLTDNDWLSLAFSDEDILFGGFFAASLVDSVSGGTFTAPATDIVFGGFFLDTLFGGTF